MGGRLTESLTDARPVERGRLARPPLEVAPDLLGLLLVTADGRAARLVEVEAYCGPDDPASHAAPGPTARNRVMWGPAGHLYVYFSYGVHWCANVVCDAEGTAGAVLLRAGEPAAGLAAMRAARWRGQRQQRDRDLCRGPGRLAQALGIGRDDYGLDLLDPAGAIRLVDDGRRYVNVVATPRIGITRAADRLARFAVADSPWVSGPAPAPAGGRAAPTPRRARPAHRR
ncbi:MAG TPA: DNA-3-methyladenine glycosylase [Acidimicrobiales bacterium]|nr:DNA-3-methyladenine glycosylase [Acidimicrobiales bacterium]